MQVVKCSDLTRDVLLFCGLNWHSSVSLTVSRVSSHVSPVYSVASTSYHQLPLVLVRSANWSVLKQDSQGSRLN